MTGMVWRERLEGVGVGHERAYEHKPYEWGDPFHLNVEQTVKNAIWRSGSGTRCCARASWWVTSPSR